MTAHRPTVTYQVDVFEEDFEEATDISDPIEVAKVAHEKFTADTMLPIVTVLMPDGTEHEVDLDAVEHDEEYEEYGVDEHPEHTECADGCGLAVTHTGACLDKPGGRVVCEHGGDE